MSSKPTSDVSGHIEFTDLNIKHKPEFIKDVEELALDEDRRRREKRLVRKLDMTLLPMVWVLYMFNYLDRNNIAQARLNNFDKDLKLVGDQFNTAVSILNVGSVLPQNMKCISLLLNIFSTN